jgi:hypothetical protein
VSTPLEDRNKALVFETFETLFNGSNNRCSFDFVNQRPRITATICQPQLFSKLPGWTCTTRSELIMGVVRCTAKTIWPFPWTTLAKILRRQARPINSCEFLPLLKAAPSMSRPTNQTRPGNSLPIG